MTNRRFAPSFSGTDAPALLRRLQAVDFALQDTVLYLDAYPDDKEALDYYHSLLGTRAGILASLPKNLPLSAYDNTGNSWDWAKGPWPWEFEAN